MLLPESGPHCNTFQDQTRQGKNNHSDGELSFQPLRCTCQPNKHGQTAGTDSIFVSWRHLGVVQPSAVTAHINYPTWKAEGVKAGWHGAAAPHLQGRLSPGCRPQSQVSMMEWCTDVDASSSSFLSLSLGSSFFWAPKQSVQSSEIRATSGEMHIVTLTSLSPLPPDTTSLSLNREHNREYECTSYLGEPILLH